MGCKGTCDTDGAYAVSLTRFFSHIPTKLRQLGLSNQIGLPDSNFDGKIERQIQSNLKSDDEIRFQ